jgi:hypothetical protein
MRRLIIAGLLLAGGEAHGAPGIIYSGPLDLVLGGLPSTPASDVFIDGGDPEFTVGSNAVAPVGEAGGYTFLSTPFLLGLMGDASGNIANFSLGDSFDVIAGPFATPAALPPPEQPGFLLTGYDFGPGAPTGALGPYFSASAAQDFYWAFSFVPNGTIGIVPGWMRVTINPVIVDLNNETLTGGELSLREYAYSDTGAPIRVGEIPEPRAIVLAGLSLLSMRALVHLRR